MMNLGGGSGEHSSPTIPPVPPSNLSLSGSTGILPVLNGLEARSSGFEWRSGGGEGRGSRALAPSPATNISRELWTMTLLETRHLGVRFGGLLALDNFSLSLPAGGLYGLIGPNGAGKTTVFNLLSGFLAPTQGEMRFSGQDLGGLPPHRRTLLGMARTFQNIRLFEEQSVLDNVLVALHPRRRSGWWQGLLHLPVYRREEREHRRQAFALLEEVGLKDAAREQAGRLPYGHQRRLEIARALGTRPRLLLLDEPAAGLNPQETMELMDFLRDLRARHGLTLLVIEHNLRLVMNLCEHLTVLDHGLTLAVGPPAEIRKNPKVIKAYLGK